jgi:hypothetical protein
MRLLRILPLMVIIATALTGVATAAALLTPGIPCSDLGQPAPGPCVAGSTSSSTSRSAFADVLFNLLNDPGTVNLGIFVVPGDVVLFEHANGSLNNPATWSDLVRFTTGPNSSFATMFADGEAGTGPFTLSLNAVSIVETQVGTGADTDFTVYTAGSATYNVHSDTALTPEPLEPMEGTPEPSTLTLLIGGSLLLIGRARQRLW